MTTRRLVLSAAASALVLVPSTLRAADAEPIVLDYAAPAGCPNRVEFEREIRGRTSAARFVEAGAGRTFRVRLEPSGAEFSGSLDVTSKTEPPAHRDIRGESCESVALVLAISVALAIDPDADTNPSSKANAVDEPKLEPVVPNKPNAPSPSASRSQSRRSSPQSGLSAANREIPRSAVDVGVALTATAGVAPEVLITPAPLIEYESLEQRLWAPLIRFQALVARSGVIGPGVAEARFTWYAGRISGCPVRVSLAANLGLRPCAVVDGGAVQAEGLKIARPRSQTRPWVTLGLDARLRWDLGATLFVDGAIGLKLAPVRYEYVFENPRDPIYHVPWVSPAGELGFGVRFF